MTTQPCLAPQREQLFPAYPVCPRCDQEYLPLPGVDACPWHDDSVVSASRRWLTEAEKAAHRNYDKCGCGKWKKTNAPACFKCAISVPRKGRGAKPGAKWGEVCQCGDRKRKGSVMCLLCRYPNSEKAQLARAGNRRVRVTEPLSGAA